MHIQQAIDEYVIWHEVSGHSAKTIAWYRWTLSTLDRWLSAHGRSTRITDITLADVRAFLHAETHRATLCPGHVTGVERAGKLSDRTLHCYVRAIRAFFNWLVVEEYLTKSPVTLLKPPKLEQRYKAVLSVPEIERLLSALNQRTFLGARMYAIIALLYDSGLRAGELATLELSDVQWSDYQLRVMGKGKKERLVPFSPATHKALRKYLAQREPFAHESSALFITAEGQRLTREAVTIAVKRLGKRAGIPRLHPHLLRHSAAVAAILNGANQFELKRILGHTQLTTTDGYMDYAQQHLAQQHRHFSPMSKVTTQRPPLPKRRKKRRTE